MKSIILTFHEALNYGAVLQAYALQKTISSFGLESFLLNYHCNYINDSHSVFHVSPLENNKTISFAKLGYRIFVALCYFPFKFYRKLSYKSFMKKYYRLIEVHDITPLDCIVVGSDQVWNLELTGGDYTFIKGLEGIKKISYAASAGSYEDKVNNELFIKALNNYEFVSVREISLYEKLKNIINKEINVVLDPTLLVNEEEFYNLTKLYNVEKQYVFVYKILDSTNFDKIVSDFASKNNLRILEPVCSISLKAIFNPLRFKWWYSPIDFLNSIRNANCVITTSFHGVALSIIFKKSFYFISSGNIAENRIESLLQQLGLENRIISDREGVILNFEKIDYTKPSKDGKSVYDKLTKLRNVSLNFLKESLELVRQSFL